MRQQKKLLGAEKGLSEERKAIYPQWREKERKISAERLKNCNERRWQRIRNGNAANRMTYRAKK